MGRAKTTGYTKLGNLEIPKDYFKMEKNEKRTLNILIMEEILEILESKLPSYIDKYEQLNEILETSIEANNKLEIYEVSACLTDIQNLLNES